MTLELIGILSAVIFIIGDIPYLKNAIEASIKPQRITWGIAMALNAIGFANQSASGADNSLWLFGAAVLMTGAIFIASLKNGVGGYSKLDIFAITTAIVGIILWQVFDSPLISILANLCVAVVALIPTFVKTKKDPTTETGIAWLFGSISAALAGVSVGSLDVDLLILPIASTLLQAYMVYLIYVLPKRQSQNTVSAGEGS